MLTPRDIVRQVDGIVSRLVEYSLADDQNFAVQRELLDGRVEVSFPHAEHVSFALGNRAYREAYMHLAQERAFNVKMPDGGLVQMMYIFRAGRVERHRLAFFPSPDLEEFQNSPEIYLNDELYAEVVSRAVVPFPFRFEFDAREEVCKEIEHPKSHLTLGQYERCRIPVTAPMTPFWFVSFLLRNFYHTAFHRYADLLPVFSDCFESTIAFPEECLVHVEIPGRIG